MLKKFERMLQCALKQTSDQMTECLSREIRELGKRTSDLEHRVDDLETLFSNHEDELEALWEENECLQAQMEKYENRARHSNIRIRGIPETVLVLQSTVIALFKELSPFIPLEMDQVNRAPAPHKPDGPHVK